MKLNKILAYLFILGLFIFTAVSASFWSGNISGGKMLLTFIFLEVISIIILSSNIKHLLKIKPLVFIVLLWFLVIPFIVIFSGGSLFDLFSVLLWPACFLSVYVLIKSNNEYMHLFSKAFIFIFIIGVIFFFRHRLDAIRNPNVINVLTEQRTNIIYFPLLTLPWLLLIKSRLIRNTLFLFLFAIVIFSLKRSAILVMLLMLIPFLKINANIFQKYKIFNIVVFLLLLSLFGYAFYKVNEIVGDGAVDRLALMFEDKGSSRLGIYEDVIKLQLSTDFSGWVVGHGHFGVKEHSPWDMSAHNDFLEVLYDYGLFIFILYLTIWLKVLMKMRKLFMFKSSYFIPYLVSISIFLIFSMVSHLILYPSYFIYLVTFWGGVEALDEHLIYKF